MENNGAEKISAPLFFVLIKISPPPFGRRGKIILVVYPKDFRYFNASIPAIIPS